MRVIFLRVDRPAATSRPLVQRVRTAILCGLTACAIALTGLILIPLMLPANVTGACDELRSDLNQLRNGSDPNDLSSSSRSSVTLTILILEDLASLC